MKNIFQIKDLSKYRQHLMGLGILGVLCAHWFGFQHLNSGIPYTIASFFCKLVFTEGFLFLSGFGLYYSFSKNNNLREFYGRRIVRILVPFVVLSFPVYLIRIIVDEEYSALDFFTQITTVYFWLQGNFYGMWYISLSVVMYFIFPLLYWFIFLSREFKLLRFVVVIVVLCALNWALYEYVPDYYDNIEIGLSKTPMFAMGILGGYYCKEKKMSDIQYLMVFLGLVFIYGISSALKEDNYWLIQLCGLVQKLVFIPTICVLYRLTKSFRIGSVLIRLFELCGKYSLEIYILHLHTYLLLSIANFSFLSPMMAATISILIGIVLSVPANRMIKIIQYFSSIVIIKK